MPELPINDFFSYKTMQIVSITMSSYTCEDLAWDLLILTTAQGLACEDISPSTELTEELISTPSYDSLVKKINPLAQKGAIAGDLLKELHLIYCIGENPSLYKARQALIEDYKKIKTKLQEYMIGYSEKLLKEIWKNFKPVSPLWAAARSTTSDWRTFWNSKEEILLFFIRAVNFADFGEKTYLHDKSQKKELPIFKENEVFYPPQDLKKYIYKASLNEIWHLPQDLRNYIYQARLKGI